MTPEEYRERREKVLNREPSPPRYTPEEYKTYLTICDSRTVKRVQDFPPKQKEALSAAIEYLRLKYPHIKEVSLAGSYMKGEWIIEETSDSFKKLRELIRHKTKISDIDLVVEGVRDSFEIDGVEFHILPTSLECTPIWDNFEK